MIVGIDFDNTIIDYAYLFSNIANQKGYLNTNNLTKSEVKQAIINKYGNDLNWQKLQAAVYGKQISLAKPYNGLLDFISTVLQQGNILYIVSHKTEFSNLDGQTKLIEPALKWLEDNKIIGLKGLISLKNVSFHPTLEAKIKKIRHLKCDLFIDDLPHVLSHRQFPSQTIPILFSKEATADIINVTHWLELQQFYQLTMNYSLPWLVKRSKLLNSLINKIHLLNNGGNNTLHLIECSNGSQYIIKRSLSDKLALLNNEFNALSLLNKYNIKNVPEVIYFSSQRAELIQGFIKGKRISNVNHHHLDKVIKFIFSLAALDQTQIKYTNISSYRNKYEDYSNAIELRWNLLNKDIIPLTKKYSIFKKVAELLLEIKYLKDKIINDFDEQLEHKQLNSRCVFPEHEKIFNPSDFGFHNILENNKGELFFLDFEYFVYDDKAKMICDFIYHAGHNISLEQKLYFLKKLSRQDFYTPALKQRISLVMDLIGFEWLLIILNIAQKDKLEQKIFANPELSVEQIIESQYDKAKKLYSFFKKNIADKKELFTLGVDRRELNFD